MRRRERRRRVWMGDGLCNSLVFNRDIIGYHWTASFYGSSYASVPLQEARSTTELSFALRTGQKEALLLLAAGRTDYCLVVLHNGALKVQSLFFFVFLRPLSLVFCFCLFSSSFCRFYFLFCSVCSPTAPPRPKGWPTP